MRVRVQDDGRAAHDRRHLPRRRIWRRCSTSIGISCATRSRPVRRRDSPSSRTWARCGSKARSTHARRRTRRAGARSSSAGRRAPADETACARKIVTNLATRAFRRPATPPTWRSLMEFYQTGPQAKATSTTASRWRWRASWPSPQFIYRIEEEPASAEARPALSHQRSGPGLPSVVLPLEHRSRTRSC